MNGYTDRAALKCLVGLLTKVQRLEAIGPTKGGIALVRRLSGSRVKIYSQQVLGTTNCYRKYRTEDVIVTRNVYTIVYNSKKAKR
jgi:hypothetical protein